MHFAAVVHIGPTVGVGEEQAKAQEDVLRRHTGLSAAFRAIGQDNQDFGKDIL